MTIHVSPPIINGNQGTLFATNWPDFYNTSTAGNTDLDIPYASFLPTGYASTPNLLITAVQVAVFGVQSYNGGAAWLKIEQADATTPNWKFIYTAYDGERKPFEHFNPGVRMTSTQMLCFSASWKAYMAGPDGYGGVSTNRQFNIQTVYTLEGV